MEIALLRALRIVIRADSDPARQALFANLTQANALARFVCWLHKRLGKTWASSILVSCYGLKSFLAIAAPPRGVARILAVAVHANARRQVERFGRWLGANDIARVRIGVKALLGSSSLVRLLSLFLWGRGCIRGLRLVHAINMRHDFLVSCRVASVLAAYARGRSILGRLRPRAIVVSSDTNPEEIGFASAARLFGIPTVFVSHTYPNPFSPPLDFSLSILEGDAAVDARRRLGPVKGQIFLAGVEGESAPL
ncbi:MAG TPA: hypothetical protein VJJ98_10405, partial [Sedimentisphaerales bacterium]|nr:hypothetical protein [Sedimentisphaerales bacterium]